MCVYISCDGGTCVCCVWGLWFRVWAPECAVFAHVACAVFAHVFMCSCSRIHVCSCFCLHACMHMRTYS
jgi:hypothetical protein